MIIGAAERAGRVHWQVLRRDQPPGRFWELPGNLGQGTGGPGDQHDPDRRTPGLARQVPEQGDRIRAGVGVIDQDQGRVTAGAHRGQGRRAAAGMQPPGRPRRRPGHRELGHQPGLPGPAPAGHQRDRMTVRGIAPGLQPGQIGDPTAERGRAFPGRQQQPQHTAILRRLADHRIQHQATCTDSCVDRLPSLPGGIRPDR
jgi:hypothetical protein